MFVETIIDYEKTEELSKHFFFHYFPDKCDVNLTSTPCDYIMY